MRALLAAFLAILSFAAASVARGGDDDGPAPSPEDFLARMKGADSRAAEDAADALVRVEGDEFVPAALAQLTEETEFHARIALGYVLAAHGEKAGLEVLVGSLAQRAGHLGYVYLTRVAPEDFGWNRDGSSVVKWRAWLAGFTDDEYRERVRRERLSPAARSAGREEFEAALESLSGDADRTKVAERLRAYAKSHPRADLVPDALEVARRLDEEAKEDAAWKEPVDPGLLSPPARTAWLVYHLRDAKGVRLPFDGYTSVLPSRRKGAPPSSGPVAELLAGGASSIPVLLELLDDRRPIRGTGWCLRRVSAREWASIPVVLRVQDAALEMLNALLPTPNYERKRTADYLSAQDPADRRALIADVRSWAHDTVGKTPSELRWIGLRRGSTLDALKAIRQIAFEEKKTKEALDELQLMFDGGRHWIYRPMICELMVELGDTSKVAEVVAAFDEGKYSKQSIQVDGGTEAGRRAEEAAQQIKERYGKASGGEGPNGRK